MIVNHDRIGLDIDEPAEIDLFLERGHGTETFKLLSVVRRTRAGR
jgi:hypothetical protein